VVAEVVVETVRTLRLKLNWPESLASSFSSELRASFPEAWVTGYEPLVPVLQNDEKDL
jgi:hypothetical protein